MIDINIIKQLREETGAGILDVKKALEKFGDDVEAARQELREKGAEKAAKKTEERTTKDGLVYSYIHGNAKVGSMVCIACETDFVAKNETFKKLCHEIAMQAVTENYENNEALLNSPYIRDESKTILDLINEAIAKTGEKIELRSFCRLSVLE